MGTSVWLATVNVFDFCSCIDIIEINYSRCFVNIVYVGKFKTEIDAPVSKRKKISNLDEQVSKFWRGVWTYNW